MKPYSLDFRQKIIDAYNNAEGSIRKLAQRFRVSPDFVRRLITRHRQEGTIAPKPHGGGREPTLTRHELEVLQTLVEEDNDATLDQLAQRLEQKTQVRVSASTISRALSQLNITRKKKSLKSSEAYKQVNQQKRVDYWELIKDVNLENLVFLDETGVNLAMFNLYGRSLNGQRAYAQKPKKKGKNLSIIGAITLTVGWLAGLSFEGGTTGDLFLGFVEEVLVPQLWPGAVVVMDNLPAHKVEGVREAITAVGAHLIYLSPYSPDFNPIENLWSKLKAYLRSAEARTHDTLHQAIKDGLNLVDLEDIRNWFAHCCYCT